MVLSMLFFCGTIGLLITMNEIDNLSEENTTELVATVINSEITNTGEDIFAEIYTKENNFSLLIPISICNNIEIDCVKNLKEGDTIFFRIENANKEQINAVDFINIVSLRTEAKSIFTLNEHNEFMFSAAKPARIASVVVASLCLFVFVRFFIQFKQLKKSF